MTTVLLYTGGTIGGRSRARGPVRDDYALAPFLARLNRRLPARLRPTGVEAVAVRPGLSENRTPADWMALARAVDRAVRGGATGVVVAHGTDTLLHAACQMERMLAGIPIPLVFTGAIRPLDAPGTDAVQNLAHAFRVARERTAPGVWVSFAGTPRGASLVLKPARARKEAFRPDCFQPVWSGPAGRVTGVAEQGGPVRLAWLQKPEPVGRRAAYAPRFDLMPAALFWLYPGFDPRAIGEAVRRGARGIVLAAYGSGTACTTPGRFNVAAAVRAAVRAGTRVALVSQHYGRLREAYGSTADLARAGAELMPETTPEAALAALMDRHGAGTGKP